MKLISVKEKLPDNEQRIMAYGQDARDANSYKGNDNNLEWVIRECEYSSDSDQYPWIYNSHCCIEILVNVTHWMMLPQPPREYNE